MGVPGDRQLIETIRRHTDRPICVDVNQGWKTPQEALDNILWLTDRGVIFVEQPLDKHDMEGHAWLKERSPIPIVADEAVQTSADVPALARAYDGINIKLMKCGGLYPAEKINAIAEANHVQCMVGCMLETKVAIAAGVSLVAAKQNITEADCDSFMYAVDPEMGMPGGFAVNGGVYTLSDKPGLGIDIDF